MEVLKLEAGLQGKLMDLPPIMARLIMDSWIKNLWLQCAQLKIKIQTDINDFQPQWIGDQELMHMFLQHDIPLDELQILNQPSGFPIYVKEMAGQSGKGPGQMIM